MNIRNFCIIAHIDHGKSTLADRLLEVTGTVHARDMQEQFLDKIELERERGITIKLQAVRMSYTSTVDQQPYVLNLIDTPGHIDFSYEVNRSLAACEGAVLLVDATQGIQAQTLANYDKARKAGLTIIPVVNKIDMPAASPEDTALDMIDTFGFTSDEIIFVSGKTGEGVLELLEAIVARVPAPQATSSEPLKAMIFDSFYDQHKGVVAIIRVMDGILRTEKLRMMHSNEDCMPLEVGHISARFIKTNEVIAGEVGYVATGLKDISAVRVGDTITTAQGPAKEPLPGYHEPKPMVFANIFPEDQDMLPKLRDAVEKYNLTDAAFTFEAIKSPIIGSGFRCGFLGLLHLDVVQERLETEYGIPTSITPPTVLYYVTLTSGEEISIQSPDEMPERTRIESTSEPWCSVTIFTNHQYIGNIMKVTENHRNEYVDMHYLSGDKGTGRAEIHFNMPLSEVISTYFDEIKSASSGYASIDYDLTEYRNVDLVKLDVMLNYEPYDILSRLVVSEEAQEIGERLVEKLKDALPRQQYKLAIQASVGGKVMARADLGALRKDVTGYLYGGDRTRKDKLLKKQAAGKKRLADEAGKISIPAEVYQKIIKV